MKPSINKATTDPVYFCFNHVQGGSHLTIQNATGADLTIEVTNQNAQQLGVGGVTWSSPAQGDLVIAAGDNATLLAPYAFVKLSGTGTGDIHLAYAEKDDEDDLAVYATPSGATLFASFVGEIYYISGEYGDFNFPFDITRSSSKYVYGTGAQSGKLVEVPPNTPAYQHDPVTGAPLGLSVEGSATNNLTNSLFPNGLSDAPTNGGLVSVGSISNLFASGSVNAIQFQSSPSTLSFAYKSFSGYSAGSWVFSAIIETDDGQPPVFGANNEASTFRLVARNNPLPLGDHKVKSLGGGKYLVWCAFQDTHGTGSNHGLIKYAASIDQSFKVTQYQLEQGTKPTSPIITTGSTLTRAADIATSDAATFGDWFSSSEGTFVVEFSLPDAVLDSLPSPFSIVNDSNVSNSIFIRPQSSSDYSNFWIYFDNSTVVTLATPSFESGTKIAFTFDSSGNCRASAEGAAIVSGQSPLSVATLNQLRVGRFAFNPGFLNGTVKLVSFEPTAVSDAKLQELSTL